MLSVTKRQAARIGSNLGRVTLLQPLPPLLQPLRLRASAAVATPPTAAAAMALRWLEQPVLPTACERCQACGVLTEGWSVHTDQWCVLLAVCSRRSYAETDCGALTG